MNSTPAAIPVRYKLFFMHIPSNFKIFQQDTFSTGIRKTIIPVIIVFIIVILGTGARVLLEIQSLDKRYETYFNNGGQYKISFSNNLRNFQNELVEIKELSADDILSNDERKMLSNGYKAYFQGFGQLSINLIQFNKNNIFTETKYSGNIQYKLPKLFMGTETFYESGETIFDENGIPSGFTPGGARARPAIKQRIRESPRYCFLTCLNYYKVNQLNTFTELPSDISFEDILHKINGSDRYNMYYQFVPVSSPIENSYYNQNFTSDNFDIELQTSTLTYEKKYSWSAIRKDAMFYFLLIFMFPFLYYSKNLITKLK